MTGKLHTIKVVYVPHAKLQVIREIEDLCANRGVKFSTFTIQLYEAFLSQVPNRTQKRAGRTSQVSLENFQIIRTSTGKSFKVKQK